MYGLIVDAQLTYHSLIKLCSVKLKTVYSIIF